MRACQITIGNFRGIKSVTLILPVHAVLVGDNNTGKTTVLEALDLALGPDRLNRASPVDEHDFHQGAYLPSAPATTGIEEVEGAVPATGGYAGPPAIEIEVTVTDLTTEQRARFGDYMEFWDQEAQSLYETADLAGTDAATVTEALRVKFIGRYDPEEDDFEGRTYFARTLAEDDNPVAFSKKDKQVCGFLYLRSLRTGSRALSLERGSLLDIILRLKEVRPQMWEKTIGMLAGVEVASDPAMGISGVLGSIGEALKRYVPKEWGIEPHLRVSDLTRESLRKVVTAFIATGEGPHAAPFYRQGTSTVNMLVLAMLSQIAQDKQNVIFAMEEPETAIPPYAQKRIVHEIRTLASQTIFTSHSPYVLEEFTPEDTVVLARDAGGVLRRSPINLPAGIKLKSYRQNFRTRFAEGLLARRILIAEGATEATAFPAACRRLSELRPDSYSSLEAMGVCTIDAGSQDSIPGISRLFAGLGKSVFAICDRQTPEKRAVIEAEVELLLMHEEHGFEDLVLKGASPSALARFAALVDWPPHILSKYTDVQAEYEAALRDYFKWSKGNWAVADFLAQCSEEEMPGWVRDACAGLGQLCIPDRHGSTSLGQAGPSGGSETAEAP